MAIKATEFKAAPHRSGASTGALRRTSPTAILLLLLVAACSSQPPVSQPISTSTPIQVTNPQPPDLVEIALAQLDKPYRYGGEGPRGFDCSGLVYYVYQRSGIGIPRTALDQQRRARPVPLRELVPGDLLFFREGKQKASHVGLYVGDGRFIHASTSRQAVKLSSLNNPYWQHSLISAGRYGR